MEAGLHDVGSHALVSRDLEEIEIEVIVKKSNITDEEKGVFSTAGLP